MVFLGCFFMFTLKYVPETKNRTIDDISQIWRSESNYQTLDKTRHQNVELNMSKEIYEQIVDVSTEKK